MLRPALSSFMTGRFSIGGAKPVKVIARHRVGEGCVEHMPGAVLGVHGHRLRAGRARVEWVWGRADGDPRAGVGTEHEGHLSEAVRRVHLHRGVWRCRSARPANRGSRRVPWKSSEWTPVPLMTSDVPGGERSPVEAVGDARRAADRHRHAVREPAVRLRAARLPPRSSPIGGSTLTDLPADLLLVTATLPDPSTAWMNHSTSVPTSGPAPLHRDELVRHLDRSSRARSRPCRA